MEGIPPLETQTEKDQGRRNLGKGKTALCGALALLLALTLCACRTVRLENGETFVITRQAHGAGGGGEAEPEQTTAPEATPEAQTVQTAQADMHYYVAQQSEEIQSLFWLVYEGVTNFAERIELPRARPASRSRPWTSCSTSTARS